MDWIELLIAIAVSLAALGGVLLTAATLPGIWFMLLCAGLAQWWSLSGSPIDPLDPGVGLTDQLLHPPISDSQMFSWWVLGVVAFIAILGEVTDFAASAVGAATAGGTKRGAIGSIIGGLLGAFGGTFIIPIPVLGTILGAALGAGLGALLAERHGGRMTWKQAGKVGSGAAVGRLAATLVKTGLAIAAALILCIDAFV